MLVLGVLPRMSVWLQDLPSKANRMNSIRTTRDELSKIVAVNRIKLAFSEEVLAGAYLVIRIGDEVLMFREKPAGNWVGPYLVTWSDVKMLKLNTGERMIDASIDLDKKYHKYRFADEASEGSIYILRTKTTI